MIGGFFKFVSKNIGLMIFGFGLLLIISGLFLNSIKGNLDNFEGVLNESIDKIFLEYKDKLYASAMDECTGEGGTKKTCEKKIESGFQEQMNTFKSEANKGIIEEFEWLMDYKLFNFNILYYISVFFLGFGFFFIWLGFSKDLLDSFRALSLQVLIIFGLFSFFLWRLSGEWLRGLFEWFGLTEEIEFSVNIIVNIMERMIVIPLKAFLVPFLIITLIGLISFVTLLFVKKKSDIK